MNDEEAELAAYKLLMLNPRRAQALADMPGAVASNDDPSTKSYRAAEIAGLVPTYKNRRALHIAVSKILRPPSPSKG